jgi:adenylate cyclase
VSFYAELKRRNVFRVGIFYAIAAWLVIEVAETVRRCSTSPLVCYGGTVLVFSWIYELTPDG